MICMSCLVHDNWMCVTLDQIMLKESSKGYPFVRMYKTVRAGCIGTLQSVNEIVEGVT